MNKKGFYAVLAAMTMIMALAIMGCGGSGGSSGGSGSNNTPAPADNTISMTIHYTIPPEDLVNNLVPSNPVYMSDEANYQDDSISEIPNYGIKAINPAPSPTYVGIFGYAIKQPGCVSYSPFEPACLRDVTSYCPGGVCAIPLKVTKSDWLDMALYYGGQVHPENITVTLNSVTYPLDKFRTMSLSPSLLAGDSLQRQWLTTCFRIDQNNTTTNLSTNNPSCTETVATLFTVEVYITGVSYNASVTDSKTPYNGTDPHDGGPFLIRGSFLPDTLVPPATDDFPQILWGGSAYSHTISAVMSSSMGGTLAAYVSSRSITAPVGDIAPLPGGVFIRTRHLGSATIVCNRTNPLSELHHWIPIGTVTQGGSGLVVPMQYYQVKGIDPVTGCPLQDPSNVLQVLGGGH